MLDTVLFYLSLRAREREREDSVRSIEIAVYHNIILTATTYIILSLDL